MLSCLLGRNAICRLGVLRLRCFWHRARLGVLRLPWLGVLRRWFWRRASCRLGVLRRWFRASCRLGVLRLVERRAGCRLGFWVWGRGGPTQFLLQLTLKCFLVKFVFIGRCLLVGLTAVTGDGCVGRGHRCIVCFLQLASELCQTSSVGVVRRCCCGCLGRRDSGHGRGRGWGYAQARTAF